MSFITTTITGTITTGVTLSTAHFADPVTIAAGASISGNPAIQAATSFGIDNFGTVTGTGGNGVYLAAGGSVTNEASGSITGSTYGILAKGSNATVENSGTITGGTDSVILNGTGANRLIVDAGAVFTGHVVANATAANTLELAAAGGHGTISGIGASGSYQYQNFQTIKIDSGATWTLGEFHTSVAVDNAGTVTEAGRGNGVVLDAGGSVTNETGGSIYGYYKGIYVKASAGTVVNDGTITAANGLGVYLNAGGSVTNETGGSIIGYYAGIFIKGSSGTVINLGTVTGRAKTYNGVYLGAGGSVTNESTGKISGSTYGVDIHLGTGTVENAGTITGGTDAVKLNGTGANRLIVDAGAVFNGNIVANASGANTLELTSHAGAGTISGLGAKYEGFQTVTIDSGATWTIGGAVSGFSGLTIQGFNTHDRLDLTDLSHLAGDTVNLNGMDLLTISSSEGGTVTLQLAGDFTGDFFHLADDGHGGTYVTEDGTPCYCRGTLILTDKGEVAVERLKIGDRLFTKSGALRPIKWIGTRSYSGRYAAGNRDVLPVLITAGALEDNVPRRDVWVSPLHAMYLDDVLIPAFALINGTSIVQADAVDQVEYFHVELDTHDVIVAEGTLAESFLDDDSRGMFHNADEHRRLYPDDVRKPAAYCAPVVEDGALLETVRARIAARMDVGRTFRAA